MNTPILKAKKGNQTKQFYNDQEYEDWKKENNNDEKDGKLNIIRFTDVTTKNLKNISQTKNL